MINKRSSEKIKPNKSLLIFLFTTGILTPVSIPPVKDEVYKPYEATWMKLTETDSGYVVYNYPHLFKKNTISGKNNCQK